MSKLTKADIDGLVDALPNVFADSNRCKYVMSYSLNTDETRTALYLAASLMKNGAPKPEKVQCWMSLDRYGRYDALHLREPQGSREFIPGTFVPDGVE